VSLYISKISTVYEQESFEEQKKDLWSQYCQDCLLIICNAEIDWERANYWLKIFVQTQNPFGSIVCEIWFGSSKSTIGYLINSMAQSDNEKGAWCPLLYNFFVFC